MDGMTIVWVGGPRRRYEVRRVVNGVVRKRSEFECLCWDNMQSVNAVFEACLNYIRQREAQYISTFED